MHFSLLLLLLLVFCPRLLLRALGCAIYLVVLIVLLCVLFESRAVKDPQPTLNTTLRETHRGS
jgi:hypothetical protein